MPFFEDTVSFPAGLDRPNDGCSPVYLDGAGPAGEGRETSTVDAENHSACPGSAGEHVLQARYETRGRAQKFYDDQVVHRLNSRMRDFVGEQEMVFVATSDSYGECDCTLRAGHPGFVRVVDDRTLAYPEYRGNGVMASLGNIFENAQVGLLFVDFDTYRIGLHVNGQAEITDQATMRDAYPELIAGASDAGAERWVVVSVVEAYIHCSKHIPALVKPSRDRTEINGVKRNGGDFFEVKAGKKARAEDSR